MTAPIIQTPMSLSVYGPGKGKTPSWKAPAVMTASLTEQQAGNYCATLTFHAKNIVNQDDLLTSLQTIQRRPMPSNSLKKATIAAQQENKSLVITGPFDAVRGGISATLDYLDSIGQQQSVRLNGNQIDRATIDQQLYPEAGKANLSSLQGGFHLRTSKATA